MLVRTKETANETLREKRHPWYLERKRLRIEHAIDRFGLFLIVAVCLAADRLPKKNSSRPIDRAIGTPRRCHRRGRWSAD
jgi:hypothetical protein